MEYTLQQIQERLQLIEQLLEEERKNSPLDFMQWLPGQKTFLESNERFKLFRSGVQHSGKSIAGASEAIFRCLGHSPFRELKQKPPINLWAIGGSESQSQIMQKKVWDLVPKDAVCEDSFFDDRKGSMHGKYPKLRFKNGSEIWFKTGAGDTISLASGTVDCIWIDEPPESERVYNELLNRLTKTNGDIFLTLTPVNRPVEWLKKRCQEGEIRDYHVGFKPENFIFAGTNEIMKLTDGTPMDQRWCEELEKTVQDFEKPVTLYGEWEFRRGESYFSKAWDPAKYILKTSEFNQVRDPVTEYILGIDFGDRPGKQVVLLIGISRKGIEDYPTVYVMDQYIDLVGGSLPSQDAAATIKMLAKHNLKWSDLTSVYSDRAHKAGRGDQKSAQDMEREIGKILGMTPKNLRPLIRSAKKGEGAGGGSVQWRSKWLWNQMRRENFFVNPRVTRLIDALPKYSPWNDDENKDPLDALVYGLHPYASNSGFRTDKRGVTYRIY